MNPHFFTAPFYFDFSWFRVQGSGLSWRLRRKYKFGALRRTTPVEPSESIEPAEPLSLAIKGRVAPGLTLKFESRDG